MIEERRSGPFEYLHRERRVRIRVEAMALDCAPIKVYPSGTGVRKKRPPVYRPVTGRVEPQVPSGGRGGPNRCLSALPRPRTRRLVGAEAPEAAGPAIEPSGPDHGPHLRRRGNPKAGGSPRLHTRGVTQELPRRSLRIGPETVLTAQRGRIPVPATQGFPQGLLAL